MKNVGGIIEKELTWDEFENIFRERHLFRQYYDWKARELYKLKLDQLSNDEYVTNFLELLRYVSYFKDEKAKIHRFFSGFPMALRDEIELLGPKTLKDSIKNLSHFNEQERHKLDFKSSW